MFGATSNCTVPFPLPLPPPAIAIHGTLLVAVHGHAAALVTPTDPEPPALATENDCVLIPKVHAVLWLTVNVCPAMVSVPVRAGPVFGATVSGTVPFPLPLPAPAIETHGTLLVEVHAQPEAVVTATELEPPVLATDCDCGLMSKRQPVLCVTVNCRWPTLSVPTREGPFHAPTLNVTSPGPVPSVAEAIVIHGASLCADQEQAAAVVTLIAPDPPSAAMVCAVGAMPTVQPPPCVTTTRCPAMVSSPLRGGPAVRAASYTTCALPVPSLPCTMVSHAVALRADHEHCGLLAVTSIVRRSPSEETESVSGETVKMHAAAWLIATCCPSIVIVPLRGDGSGLVATLKATLALPWPADGAPSCIQLPDDAALH